jgi:hypothetical protein
LWGKKNGDQDGTDRTMTSRGDVGRCMGLIGNHFETWLATGKQSGPFHDSRRRPVLWFCDEPREPPARHSKQASLDSQMAKGHINGFPIVRTVSQ